MTTSALKILVISQYYWPEEFRINDLVLGLRNKSHHVTVLTGIPNYPAGRFFPGYGFTGPMREKYHGVEVLRVPLLSRGDSRSWRLVLNYLSFAFIASLLGPLRCRDKFDLIFVYEPSPITVGIPALVLKKIKRIPIMFWVQDLWPESLSATDAVRSSMALHQIERLVRFIYRGCDLLLVQAEGFRPRVIKVGARPEQVRYFPNWAEDLYQPVTLEADAPERTRVPDGFRVMYAGNIGAAQDFPTIIAAAERLKDQRDIKWIVLGNGRMRDWVEAQISERGLSNTVHLLGRFPVESIPRYSALADTMLVTLKRSPIFALTIPTKVQSYLACAKPIVAALEGEGAQVIEEAGAGVTCPPENPEALARAVMRMRELPESERQAMGLRGRSYFDRHFERNMLIDRLEGWMQQLVQCGIMPQR